MPLRYPPTPLAQCVGLGLRLAACQTRQRVRAFHGTGLLQNEIKKTHYEVLHVSTNASLADIKKSFYKLSKTYHPDHNPDDPSAPQRFVRISEAYSVLSHADKRAKYDRDVLRLHSHAHAHTHEHARQGSYHSTNPAGGRPPSGLSRRRSTFTGPPPSFFRSGGWGAHSDKRRAAHEESTGGAGSSSPGTSGAGPNTSAGAGQWGGMGPGQDPYGHHDDVPHFDRASHERTGQAEDARRTHREKEKTFSGQDMGVVQGFLVVSGILAFAVMTPIIFLGGWKTPRAGKKKNNAG